MTEIVVLTKDELKELIREVIREELRGVSATDEVGDISLAVRITGLKPVTIYKKVANNSIPFYQDVKGGKITFSRNDLTAWLDTTRKKTQKELSAELRHKIK